MATPCGRRISIPGTVLTVTGEAAAGRAHAGVVGPGEAVRIFTGAPVPDGADAVLVQEQARREGNRVTAQDRVRPGQNIRRTGLDFRSGDAALAAPLLLSPRDLALAAAANHPSLVVRRRPVVAILATGDEIVMPGGRDRPEPDRRLEQFCPRRDRRGRGRTRRRPRHRGG